MPLDRWSLRASWWRSRRCYVLALTALLLLDGIMSIWAVASGSAHESNPLVAPMMDSPEGQALLILLKALLATFIAYCSFLAYRIMKTSEGRRRKAAYWTEIAMWCWNIGVMSATLGNNIVMMGVM